MSLRFNTYRAKRYLRSRFVEGKYLLASEASDLQLESLQVLRKSIEKSLGSAIAVGEAWKVELYSPTQLLIKPGDAWVKGLPFNLRSGGDQLVSGAVLSIGIVPVGVSVTDEPTGAGKILTFNNAATTPTSLYKIIVSAQEELITDVDDPFLKNLNLTESTAQKVRLVYKLHVVPSSFISSSPIPYRDETSTSVSVTNFPNAGGFAHPNLSNEVVVSPSLAGNGEMISIALVTGSEGIDGRDVEIVIRNDGTIGGGIILPNSPVGQQSFANSTLVDSVGNIYHVNAIFNDTISTQLVIRVDKEVDQPNPQLINGSPYTLIKRDVYVTDDVNGSPQGKVYWDIATADWHQSNQFTHDSKVVDIRESVLTLSEYQDITNKKLNLIPTGGGNISFGVSGTDLLTWASDITVLNSFGPSSVIQASTAALIEDGALIYDLDFESGGIVSLGNLALTILTGGSTLTMAALDDLSSIKVGNIIKIGSELAQITAINNVSKQLQVSPAIVGTGAATVYLDSYANNTAILSEKSYVFATRKGNKVWVGGGSLELENGETNQLGDGVPQAILDFIGATSEIDDSPLYTSTTVVTQGGSLVQAISELDADLGAVNAALATPIYDERILYPAGLAASTNITIPNNSRDSGNPHFYVVGEGKLQIFVNQVLKFAGADYLEIDNQTIQFTFALPNDAEVHFREAVLGGGSGGGGGSSSLQDAYNLGRQITVTAGNPVEISGPSGKLLKVNGDVDISGVIDPKGIEFTPQNSNPLGAGSKGLWVNLANQLIHEDGTTNKNLSQAIEDLETGLGINGISRLLFNNTGLVIPKGTPVYSPSAGEIAPASGSALATANVIGIASENIAPASNGNVLIVGVLTGIAGFTHNSVLYLDATAGTLTESKPTLGPYPSGYVVFIVGIMEGTNLYIRPQFVGIL